MLRPLPLLVALTVLAGLAAVAALVARAGPAVEPVLTLRLAAPLADLPLPPVAGPDGRPIVVIDAGHGGHDPGAVGDGVAEKDVTLAAARALALALIDGGRVRVALTRRDDRYLAHQERYEIARRLGAALFVSLHADAAPGASARGASVYTLAARASDDEAARTEARENRIDRSSEAAATIASSESVDGVLADLTHRETLLRAARFADLVVRTADGRVPLRPTPRRSAPLLVLRAPDVPSVLLEMGYLTDPDDRAFLVSDAGRAAIGAALAEAIETWVARSRIDAQATGASTEQPLEGTAI